MRTSLNNIISADILPISQIDLNCMYIEKLPTITLNEIIADTNLLGILLRSLFSGDHIR